MAERRIATRDTSLADTAMLFDENGISIVDWFEGEEGPVQMIRFRGNDDSDGFKAVEIAREIGLWPIELRRVWYYRYGLEDFPSWELIFNYPPEEGQIDETTLSLMVESLSYTPLYRTSPTTSSATIERPSP